MSKLKGKLLVVEDDLLKLAILKIKLVEADYAVVIATNPLEAETCMETSSFDVIITDLQMPGKDGLSFLKDVKKKTPGQPVIVMSANGKKEKVEEIMSQGAFAYLQKPFFTEELIDILPDCIHS